MSNKRVAFISFLILAVIIALSSVSASDLTYDYVSNASNDNAILSTPITDIQEDNIYYSDSEILSSEADTPLEASKSSTKGTFTELQKKINSAKKGSTIYLTKDYYYNKDFGTLNGIKITKQITIDGKGHAIDGKGKSALLLILKTNNVVLKNIVFRNGEIDDVGTVGVFYSNNVKFTKCQFDKNYAENGGAVVLAYSDSSSFDSCKFKKNMAEYNGGAIYLDHSSSTFKSCTFNDNEAEYGGAIYLDYSSSTFKTCTFNRNEGYYSGGALYLDYSSSTFKSCEFNGNSADNCGGAIYLNHSSTSFNFCDFNYNEVYYGSGIVYNDYSSFSCGGAVYSIQSVLNCLNTNFNDNYAETAGGDLYSQYSMIFLENSLSMDSSSNGFGGSLSFNNDYVQLTNHYFKDCGCYDGGGAIYSLNSILTTISSRFEYCGGRYGGAICSLNTDLVIKNNTFEDDWTEYSGGSIYTLYGSITLDSSIFSGSHASRGGAIYIRSPHKINNITNNQFLYCSAEIGPRIYVDEYYDEIPESGNKYEEVYFLIGKFIEDLDYPEYSNFSNILTYVYTNYDEFQDNFSFYDELKEYFVSETVDFIPDDYLDNHFNITDEYYPNNSTILLNNTSHINSNVKYDVGHFNNEFNSTTNLEFYFFNMEGDLLEELQILPYVGNNSILNSSLKHIVYYSDDYYGGLIYPLCDDEKNISVFDKKGDKPYIWVCSSTPEKFNHYKIAGKFSFNIDDMKLYYNRGNIYDFQKAYNPVPIFNYEYQVIEDFPSYYDGRDLNYVTPVKNQGIGSNCWAFAGIATLETCIKKITGKTFDLSENNAKNVMASSSVYGLNLDTNAGGYDTMFISYLASWLGPNPSEKYNPLSSLSMELKTLLLIQNIPFLHARQNSEDNDEFKYAIMNYGAVCVIFNWTEEDNPRGLHSVSLVGWDDNYDDIDSLGNYAKGAWIFKNSWGDEWEDDGFGYLSYEQKLSGEIAPYMHAYSFKFNDSDIGYHEIYQYDFAGLSDFLCTDTDYIYYKNKFIAKDNEYLLAFSTYFEKETNFTFSVRINGKDITTTDDNIAISNSVHNCSAGYHVIPLGYNLTLNKGDEFEIIIKLINDSDENYIPVCQADELYKASYPSNVSFFSYNGEDWIDLYDLDSNNRFAYGGNKTKTSQIACIKAFSARKSSSIGISYYINPIDAINKTYEFYQLKVVDLGFDGEYQNIRIDILDWDHDNENYDNFIELNDDKKTYYFEIKDGNVLLISYNVDYTFSTKITSNYYISDYLIYTNTHIIKGNETYLGTLRNVDGRTYKIKDIDVKIINQNDKSNIINLTISYNNQMGGYVLNTSTLDYGTYRLSGTITKDSNKYVVMDGIIYVVKKSILKAAANLTKVYGKNNKLTATLKDENGKAISNAYVYVKLNGKTTKIKTNSKGQATLSFKLVPKTYTAVISYKGSEKYSAASTKVKIIIKKATPKIIASKKTFSKKTKTKKYTITLKNNLGKIMKNKKVTLKVKGKTYSVKTDNSGKATFKLKLTYKGEFTGLIKYDGNKYYNAVSKKVAITVK